MTTPQTPPVKTKRYTALYIAAFMLCAVGMMVVLLLLENIATRKQEARHHVFQIVELTEQTVDPAEWGKNYPRQYDSYKRTVDIERTRHGGSEAFQKLDKYPVWRELWAGYAFSVDFREERGHAYMLDDQRETLRVKEFNQPGACLHCHSSVTNAYREQGIKKGAPGTLDLPINHPDARAQLHKGFEEVCAMPYTEATKLVQHPVTCLDCHDPGTMELRVTRPAFFEGIAALARSDDPLPHLPSIERWRKGKQDEPYDPNFLASRHEMRSLVCAQCHVEYYFQGDGKKVVYPWHKGLKVEQMEAVYDERNFHDWIHAVTGAPMLKAQHPEFEMWSQGTHARAGVSCADCHMPYRRDGAIKISDHHVRSPLLNIARACQTCHRVEESELLARAENIQDRTAKLMRRTETAVHDLLLAIKAGMDAGMSDEQLKEARQYQRQAQWRLDFVNAENSMGFHAAQEAARILGESIDMARKGQISVLQSRSVSSADADGSGGVDEQVVTMNDFVIRFAAQNP